MPTVPRQVFDGQGHLLREELVDVPADMVNHGAILDKCDVAISYFGSKGQTSSFAFAGLTAAQQNAHIRRMNSAIESFARLVQNQFDSAGD